ncbi:hypothetical protein D3C76_1406420 [compost metagenome]
MVGQGRFGVDIRRDFLGAHPGEAPGLIVGLDQRFLPGFGRPAGGGIGLAAIDLVLGGGTYVGGRLNRLRLCLWRPALDRRQFVLRVRDAASQQHSAEQQVGLDDTQHGNLPGNYCLASFSVASSSSLATTSLSCGAPRVGAQYSRR